MMDWHAIDTDRRFRQIPSAGSGWDTVGLLVQLVNIWFKTV